MFCFCTYFLHQTLRLCWWGRKIIFCPSAQGTLATPLADSHLVFQYKGFQTPYSPCFKIVSAKLLPAALEKMPYRYIKKKLVGAYTSGHRQGRNQDFAKGGAWNFEVLLYHSQFLRLYWPNHATHRSTRHKKIKTIRYFIFFVNFDMDKGGASAPLAPSLVAPLDSGHEDATTHFAVK